MVFRFKSLLLIKFNFIIIKMIRSPSKKHLIEANEANSNLPLNVHAVSSSEDDEDYKDFQEAE